MRLFYYPYPLVQPFEETAGLVVAFSLVGPSKILAAPAGQGVPAETLDSWLNIAADGRVTLHVGRVELGTGIETAYAQIAAEELDVPFGWMSVVQGDTARTVDQGHGRQETRQITVSRALIGYSDWPGLAQVFQLERERIDRQTGRVTREVVHGLTSLDANQASPQQWRNRTTHLSAERLARCAGVFASRKGCPRMDGSPYAHRRSSNFRRLI